MAQYGRYWVLMGVMAWAVIGWGAPAARDVYVGAVYPAGGQQGTVVRVTAVGQRLGGANAVEFTGAGVRAVVTGYVGAGGPLNRAQQDELQRRIKALLARGTGAKAAVPPAAEPQTPPVALPDLPDLRGLEQQTPAQLRRLADKYLNQAKRNKPPLAEVVTLEVTIDPGATLGDRELRLRTRGGLSNPVRFQVGRLPEIREPSAEDGEGELAPVQAPAMLNGQIMPGEVDRFPVQLHGGQQLVIVAEARRLMPYLADAVPGWFQAVLALYDAQGKELAYVDDTGGDPDPILRYQVPADGTYMVVMRDALYRGRKDFVYRLAIGGEDDVRPLLPKEQGWSIPVDMARDGEVADDPLQAYLRAQGGTVPQREETEPNDRDEEAAPLVLPQVIGGRIASPGDTDVFRFAGRTGEEIVAEVYARRRGSPLDALLRLRDAQGRVLAWNDDNRDPGAGLVTHHADAYLKVRLPETGTYSVQVSDVQHHGGADYRYYLRIGPPQPDYALRLTPSSLTVPAGGTTTFTVYAQRKDGWDGDIPVVLTGAPPGFTLSGARIPAGRDSVRMTLTVPRGPRPEALTLRLEGQALIDGKVAARPVVPADDRMQAFAYHHLVPAQALTVLVTRSGPGVAQLGVASRERVRIPAGGQASVTCTVSPMPAGPVQLTLVDPPAGVTLLEVKTVPGGLSLVLTADKAPVGFADNLIVEASAEAATNPQGGAAAKPQRISLGVFPAIPFEIVQP